MFRNAKVNGSRYCGPVVLSAVTGIGTKELGVLIRAKNRQIKAVKGIWNSDLLGVLDHFSVRYTPAPRSFKPCVFRTWLQDYRAKDKTYIVCLTDHYVAVRNDDIICTQFGGKITPIASSKHLGKRVKQYWVIDSGPKKAEIPVLRPNVAKSSVKRRVLLLCRQHGISIEHNEHDRDDDLSIWMYLPDELIDNEFNGNDPWDDEHYFYSYDEALERIEKIFGKSSRMGLGVGR